jgi:hypothetical protein
VLFRGRMESLNMDVRNSKCCERKQGASVVAIVLLTERVGDGAD